MKEMNPWAKLYCKVPQVKDKLLFNVSPFRFVPDGKNSTENFQSNSNGRKS